MVNQPASPCTDVARWAESESASNRLEPWPASIFTPMTSRLRGEAAGAQQRIDFRIPAAEITVGLTRVHTVADAHDVIAQALCNGFVEGIARLDERIEGVVI